MTTRHLYTIIVYSQTLIHTVEWTETMWNKRTSSRLEITKLNISRQVNYCVVASPVFVRCEDECTGGSTGPVALPCSKKHCLKDSMVVSLNMTIFTSVRYWGLGQLTVKPLIASNMVRAACNGVNPTKPASNTSTVTLPIDICAYPKTCKLLI